MKLLDRAFWQVFPGIFSQPAFPNPDRKFPEIRAHALTPPSPSIFGLGGRSLKRTAYLAIFRAACFLVWTGVKDMIARSRRKTKAKTSVASGHVIAGVF